MPIDAETALAQMTDQLAAHLGQPVEAACPMTHRGMHTATAATRMGGLLGRAVAKGVQKDRAGGLPEKFLLGLTGDDVVAVAYRQKGLSTKIVLGAEAARWPRAGLRAEVAGGAGPYQVNVDITPAGGETVRVVTGDTPPARAFVERLNSWD